MNILKEIRELNFYNIVDMKSTDTKVDYTECLWNDATNVESID